MTFSNETEKLKAQIQVLQSKLSFLEEMEKTKTPVEEAFKDWWGQYPETGTWDGFDEKRWQGFQAGYEFAYAISTAKEVMEKVQEEQEVREWDVVRESMNWCKEHPDKDPLDWVKPQTPEQVADGLKEAFVKAQQTEKWKQTQKLIDEVDNNKNFKNSLDLIKERGEKVHKEVEKVQDKNWYADAKMDEIVEELKGQTLYDLIGEFLNEIDYLYNTDSERKYFLEKFEQWLPKPQSAEGSQNFYVECTVDGYNDCLNQIKRKLR